VTLPLAADKTAHFVLKRELGISDDRLYDTRGGIWRLYYNPRPEKHERSQW
jgi:hypothetical protein